MPPAPEALARQQIDAQLVAVGWIFRTTRPSISPPVAASPSAKSRSKPALATIIGVITDPAVGDATTVYYGSAKSNKYHLPSCPWAQKISADNLAVFKTEDEAAAKGYQP